MHITLSHFPPHRSNKPVLTHHLPYWNSIWVRMCVCVCVCKVRRRQVLGTRCQLSWMWMLGCFFELGAAPPPAQAKKTKHTEPKRERARASERRSAPQRRCMRNVGIMAFTAFLYLHTLSHTHTHTLSWLFPKQLPEFTWLPGTERVEITFSGIFHALPGRAKKWRDRGTEPQLPVTHVLPSLLCSISFSLPLLPFFACPRFFFLSTCPRKETISIVN